MTDRRMDAYYYGFDRTNVEAIDKLLGAVACAGKAFHHTEEWGELVLPYEDHTGRTPVEWIQNAAKEAADTITTLRAEKEKLRAALSVARDCVIESFDHVKTTDDQVMADARLRDIDAALGEPATPDVPAQPIEGY